MDPRNEIFQADSSMPVANQNLQVNRNMPSLEPKKSSKVKYIVVGVLILFVVVLVIIGIMFCIVSNDNSDVSVGGNEADENAASVDNLTLIEFKKLTKTEVMAFLQDARGTGGKLPANYVGEEMANSVIMNGNTIVSDLKLIYSYDTIGDLKQMVERKYGGWGASSDDVVEGTDYEIKEYDYHAIVKPKRIDGATSCDHGYNNDCDSLFSFKSSYLNYLNEETSPHSFRDVFYLNTRNPEIVNQLLRDYTFFAGIGFSGYHGNIYGYDFADLDDKFVLTVYYIGVGLNLEELDSVKYDDISEAYAINLFLRRYAANKTDGEIYIMPAENSTIENVKSFSITEEEVESLMGY